MVVEIASLAVLVGLGVGALAQPEPGDQKVKTSLGLFEKRSDASKPAPKSDNQPKPPPAASGLEGLLSQAMQSNPDIRVAEAKVREAEAELHRIWLQVAQKVIALHHSLEAQKAAVATAEAEYKRVEELVKRGAASTGEAQHKQEILETKKATLATLEAEMLSALGKLPQAVGRRGTVQLGDYRLRSDTLWAELVGRFYSSEVALDPLAGSADATARLLLARRFGELTSAKPPIAGSMADRIRKALETPITADYGSKSLQDVLKDLEQKTPGITFITRRLDKIQLPLIFRFTEPTPLSAVFQALEDAAVIRIAVREYGFFVTSLPFPEGYLSIDEFLKSRAGGNTKRADFEGAVTAVDSNTGDITINLGSSSGVFETQMLDVYRIKPEPKYLGKVRVMAVRPNQSIAEPAMIRAANPKARTIIQVGDQVTGSLKASGRE
jgi:hypothetical protein